METKKSVWADIEAFCDPDESVTKYVFTNRDAVVESVLYRYPDYRTRTVVCCSVQSGCPVGCRFCGTGDAFVRSLTTDEIVAQPVYAIEQACVAEDLEPAQIERLQIMFMSMGEPMLNQHRLCEAIRRLHTLYPNADLLVSTSGPDVDMTEFVELSREIDRVGLQVSVHESTDQARDKLIPFAKKLPLAGLAAAAVAWAEATGRRPFFNYCVHDGNNADADIERLRHLFDPAIWEATLSVICERDETMARAHERQARITADFASRMLTAGFSVRMFNPAGQDSVGGGCGQLWFVQQWFKDHPDLARPNSGAGLPVIHWTGRTMGA